MKQLKINIIILLLISFALNSKSQGICDSLQFIRYDKNQIIYNESDTNLFHLIQKFQKLNSDRAEKIQIVQIGDSHLQAGFLTERIKQNLFQYYNSDNSIASPGFIFPFTIAQTNNPFFYKINYTGKWEWCKNIDSEKSCKLGLSGITVRTKDSFTSFSIKMQNQKYNYSTKYYFNQIKIFYNTNPSIQIKANGENTIVSEGYSFLQLNDLTDSVTFNITNTDSSKYVEIYGLILENNESNLNYNTIGVNGATAQSYLKCDYFSDQLKNINPDLVILSLGTNEAYDSDFSEMKHEFELKDLIYQIQDVAPNAAIILTTPNDHLKNRKDYNPNILKVRDNILIISKEFQLSTWDFYTIMGGENSIQEWYNKGLTGEDKLHFKRVGYEIQGDLFAKALINLIEQNELK